MVKFVHSAGISWVSTLRLMLELWGCSDPCTPCPHGTWVLHREKDNALINQVDRFRWWRLPERVWHKVT